MKCTIPQTNDSFKPLNDTWLANNETVTLYSWLEDTLYQKVIPVICIFGIIGNILNLIVLTRKSLTTYMDRMEKSAHAGLVALALSDLLFCLSALPHSVQDHAQFEHESVTFWLLYGIYGNGIINIFIMSSTWLTVAMAMSRYLAICFPIRGRQILGMTFSAVIIALVFMFCIIFNLPRFLMQRIEHMTCSEGWLAYYAVNGPLGNYPRLEQTYMWLYFVLCILLPLIVLAYCNVYLVQALRSSNQMRRQHTRSHDVSGNSKIILTLTLTVIVICYICLVTPAELLNFTKHQVIASPDFFDTERYNLAVAICNTLQAVNFAFNFVLYCVINTNFRRTIKFLFRCRSRESVILHMRWSLRQDGYSITSAMFNDNIVRSSCTTRL